VVAYRRAASVQCSDASVVVKGKMKNVLPQLRAQQGEDIFFFKRKAVTS
jgi:hypothetical protein